jgi:hypothetical protein
MADNCSFRVLLIRCGHSYDAAKPLHGDFSGPVLNLATVRFQAVGVHVTLLMPPQKPGHCSLVEIVWRIV